MLQNEKHLKELQSPTQAIKGRVEIYKGSTLETTCTCDDVLKSFTIGKEGENKFFGFGICHNLNMALMGQDVPLAITKEHYIKVAYGVKYQEDGKEKIDFLYPYPTFYLQEPVKDAETDEVTLVGYDKLYKAADYTVADLGLSGGYTIRTFTAACASLLGVGIAIGVADASFDTSYPGGANFEGTENLRDALNAIAEATQTIYYINNNDELTFKRLDRAGEPVWTIDRSSYISLKNGDSIVLSRVVHATELGDNVAPGTSTEGVTQYVRNNPFWDLREDIATLVNNAQANVEGLAINPFECEWFGNHLLEVGDKIKLITRKGVSITSYLLNDNITYSGSLSEATSWTYEEDEAETADNPTSLGETLNQTFARVDKINKRIDLVASDVDDNAEKIAQINITTEGIKAEVKRVEDETKQSFANLSIDPEEITAIVSRVDANESAISALQVNADSISASVTTVENKFDGKVGDLENAVSSVEKELALKMTADEFSIQFNEAIKDGVGKVETSTGYKFNDEGLTISRSNSEMTTLITEDGMTIKRDNTEVLKADNTGVKAQDLHATTYLIVGGRSRFQDYDNNGQKRTGCYWIGGMN